MASTRMAFGAVLGTITDTATAVSDLVTTLGDGIGMLHATVHHASNHQKQRHVADNVMFREELITESTMRIAQSGAVALEFCRQSEDNAKLFDDAQSKLLAAFEAFDKPTSK